MISADHGLRAMLTIDLPPGFTQNLVDSLPLLYQEAHAAVNGNPDLGDSEANYLLGHYRRAIAETKLRQLALLHNIFVETVKPEKGGCEHVRLKVGRFALTMCHVPCPAGFPRQSESREQYALINEHIRQQQIFPVQSNPANSKIYGIIIHTEESHNKQNLASAAIGFPNHSFDGWVEEPIDLMDLRDIQVQKYQREDDLQSQVQSAEPVWKSHEQLEEDTE